MSPAKNRPTEVGWRDRLTDGQTENPMDRETDIIKQTKGSADEGDMIPMRQAVYTGDTKSFDRL